MKIHTSKPHLDGETADAFAVNPTPTGIDLHVDLSDTEHEFLALAFTFEEAVALAKMLRAAIDGYAATVDQLHAGLPA